MELQQLRSLVSGLHKRREDFRDVLELQQMNIEGVRMVQGRSMELQFIILELERIISGAVGEDGLLEDEEYGEEEDDE